MKGQGRAEGRGPHGVKAPKDQRCSKVWGGCQEIHYLSSLTVGHLSRYLALRRGREIGGRKVGSAIYNVHGGACKRCPL